MAFQCPQCRFSRQLALQPGAHCKLLISLYHLLIFKVILCLSLEFEPCLVFEHWVEAFSLPVLTLKRQGQLMFVNR